MLTIEWCNQRFELLPQKAIHWPAHRAVLVADVHFGKAAAFRTFGVPVPEATTAHDVQRLSSVIASTRCERLIVMGDLLHASHGRSDSTMDAIRAWRSSHQSLEITLVRGNHDAEAGDPPEDWRITCVHEPWMMHDVELRHAPITASESSQQDRPSIAGHIHPSVRLRDADGTSLRTPCFIFGQRSALMPAFGSFTGTHTVRPNASDRVFAIGADEILEVTCTSVARS